MNHKIITVQPSEFIDNLWDGQEGTRLPYPFHADEQGRILRQDFWQGKPIRVIGFQARVDVQQIDLWWKDAWKDPQRAVGMYVVTQNSRERGGGMATHLTAVRDMDVHEGSEV